MTPLLLQYDLVEDLKECLSDLRFPNQHGETVPIGIFRNSLPILRHKDYSEMEYNETEVGADPHPADLTNDLIEAEQDDPFPYVIVRLSHGNVKNPEFPQTVDVVFIIGVYSDKPDQSGTDGILTIIDRIYERYAKNPIVHGRKAKIRFDGEQQLFHWVLQDDDTWPYYFGAVQAEFEMMPIERVSKYT